MTLKKLMVVLIILFCIITIVPMGCLLIGVGDYGWNGSILGTLLEELD